MIKMSFLSEKEKSVSSAKGKRAFLDSVEIVAGSDVIVREMIDLIEENGREISLVRTTGIYPKITKEEYAQERAKASRKAKILFGDEVEISDALPEKFEDFQEIVKLRPRQEIPQYKIVLPDNWDTERNIGLCAVPPSAQEFFLPGWHLAGYSRQITVTTEGATPGAHSISYSTVPATIFWHGMARIHACCVASLNLLNPEPEEESIEEAAQRVMRSMEGEVQSMNPKVVAFQIIADQLVAKMLDVKFGNLLKPTIVSFFPPDWHDRDVNFRQMEKEAVAFIMRQFDLPKPQFKLEAIAAEVLLVRILRAIALPLENLISIYKRASRAMPAPHTQIM